MKKSFRLFTFLTIFFLSIQFLGIPGLIAETTGETTEIVTEEPPEETQQLEEVTQEPTENPAAEPQEQPEPEEEAPIDSPVIRPASDISGPATIASIFPDPILANYVAVSLGRTVNALVTQADLNRITRVDVQGSTFHNPEGFQYLNSLNEVRISNSQLTQRFPQEFVDRVQNREIQIYVANNQNYTNELINLTNSSVAEVKSHVPPVLFQMADAIAPNSIGTWTILNQFSGQVASIPAYNGDELENLHLPETGRYTVVLTVGTNWMDLENSIYRFPVEFTGQVTGTISGTVTGQNGLPIPGITITFSNGATTTTNASGQYSYTLDAGSYSVTASGNGYFSQTKGATVTAGQNTVVDFTMISSNGSFRGTVLDLFTDAPIPGATVILYDASFNPVGTTTTDNNGQYAFQNIPPGSYEAIAGVTNYNPGNSQRLPVGSGMTTIGDIFLTPIPSTLSGYVTNANTGDPIPGATITLSNGTQLTTDANGYYSTTIFAGNYTATASATGFSSSQKPVIMVFAQNTQVDFQLVPNPGTLYGTVTDSVTGSPLPNTTITLSDGHTVTTDASGSYSITLAPGTYDVTASLENYESQTQTGAVIASNTSTQVDFQLVPTFGILSGYVYDATNSNVPIPGATVTLPNGATATTDATGFYQFTDAPVGTYNAVGSASGYISDTESVTVQNNTPQSRDFYLVTPPPYITVEVYYANNTGPVEGATINLSDGTSALTDASGIHVFPRGNGTYEVTVSKEGYYSIPTESTAVIENNTSVTLRFYLQESPASLNGYVADLDSRLPIPGATVTLSNGRTVTTDQNGYYSFDNLPAGTYSLTVMHPNYQGVTDDDIVLISGEATQLNVPLIPAYGLLNGYVTYEDGTPAANIPIEVEGSTYLTDTNGYYSSIMQAGIYEVVEASPDYVEQYKQAVIMPNHITEVDFILREIGQLEGTVTDADTGAPIPDVTISIVEDGAASGITLSTDANGQYSADLGVGNYSVTASKAGYLAQEKSAAIVANETTVVDFMLEAPDNLGLMEGHVRDKATKEPIAGAVVSVNPRVVTDQNGYYSLALTQGNYSVIASANGYLPQTQEGSITAGETTVLDFYLERPAGSSSSGGASTGDFNGTMLLQGLLLLSAVCVIIGIKRKLD